MVDLLEVLRFHNLLAIGMLGGTMLLDSTWGCRFLGIVMGCAIASLQDCALAQSNIVPDNTLGSENSTIIPNFSGLPIEVITDGAQRGQNLFHSFQQFNVGVGRGAYFYSPSADIQNILARVTGSERSEILGRLGTFGNSNPNLFLINPNGILFGPNASLDVGSETRGSFVASTLDALVWSNGTQFSATNPGSSGSLLTIVGDPSGFVSSLRPSRPIEVSGSFLNVYGGQSLLLLGGDVSLDNATLSARSGRIDLGGVSGTGTVGLNVDGNKLRLSFPNDLARADILLNNQTLVKTSGEGGGDVQVYGRHVMLTTTSQIASGTQGARPGGTLAINASESVELSGVTPDGQLASALFADTDGTGSAGSLSINTKRLILRDGAGIITNTSNEGQGGDLNINASESVELSGVTPGGEFGSAIAAETNGAGTGGNLNIITKRLIVRDGAFISADTTGEGRGGNLTVNASDSVELLGTTPDGRFLSGLFAQAEGNGSAGDLSIMTGQLFIQDSAKVSNRTSGTGSAGNLRINTNQLIIRSGGVVTSATAGNGQGGNLTVFASEFIEVAGARPDEKFPSGLTTETQGGVKAAGDLRIETRRLTIQDGAGVSTSTFGEGRAGSLTVNASEYIVLSGTRMNGEFPSTLQSATVSTGSAGNLQITTGQLVIQDNAQVVAATLDRGNAANIHIQANSLSLTNTARITSLSAGQGKAGNINITARDTLQANNSEISTNATSARGGDITITAKDIRLSYNSDIKTNSNEGDGGNIFLSANSIIAFDDSDILAFSRDSVGGNITLNTRAFFGSGYQAAQRITNLDSLDGNNRVDVNATGALASGNIFIPDTSSIQNNLSELSQTPIDTNALIANSCIARTGKPEGTFIITGAGGLPNRPGDAWVSSYPTGDVRNVQTENASRPWQKGDPIVEPLGVYRLSSGQLVLSRECR